MTDHTEDPTSAPAIVYLARGEEARLTISGDGAYAVLACRSPFVGSVRMGVQINGGIFTVQDSLHEVTADSPEGLLRTYARVNYRFGRMAIARRGVDELRTFIV